MNKDLLLKMFKTQTSGKNHSKAQRILKNDLVTSVKIKEKDSIIYINGKVISEYYYGNYKTNIKIECLDELILSTECTCKDFENNIFQNNIYACKHIMATFYKSLDELDELFYEPEKNAVKETFKTIFKEEKPDSKLPLLLGDNSNKDEIKIEVYINRDEWTNKISADFKIGLKGMISSKLYILKDINQFLISYSNKIPTKYGKNFTFDLNKQNFSVKDKRLVEFINFLKSIENPSKFTRRSINKNLDGKLLKIPKELVRNFFEVIKNHRVYLNEGFFYKPVETEILFNEPNIIFDLKTLKDDYILKFKTNIPITLSDKQDVFLYNNEIYLPSYDFCYKFKPYLEVFNEKKSISFNKSEEKDILKELIPNLKVLSQDVILSKSIQNKIVSEPVKFNFYFDKEGTKVALILKVKYGEYEFNIFNSIDDKIIYRDLKKERDVIGKLRGLGFEEVINKFHLIYGDDYIFNFFKNKLYKLQEIGEVYYSEKFKGIKTLNSKGLNGKISSKNHSYFEMDFKIDNVSEEESLNILKAFRENLKYFKLKTGEYLDLEEIELKNFFKILDILAPNNIKNSKFIFNKNKGVFLNNFIEENNIRYLKGKKELKEIKDKFKNIDKLKFKEPSELTGILREYQKIGFNWFKTLDYLGFGGILSDEMGLGKTLQTIAFILSNKNSKTLIVAPTSLLYNWYSEFQKFAPTLKVIVNNGNKNEREEIIDNLKDIDVIITTYNLLKRDLEKYTEIEFDCCILDEAQNIKNSSSQNASSVKEIKSRGKFALSGTPIENSLMELWSIFDFVMPDYLYDEKTFSTRYDKKLNESSEVLENLNNLIKPFILRRKKKDVIKELPDKIEKKIEVSLNDEQKKVYSVYANHAIEVIKKKVKNDEFKKSKIEILAHITKLRQLCLEPSILVNDYNGESSKLEALVEIVSNSIEQNHRILVFSQFTEVLKKINNRFTEEGIHTSYLDGSTPSNRRMEIVQDFNNGENSVFLISLKAGGTGLNLTSADVVIHFDPWWNPAVEEQATDRAHRIGQKNVVEVIKLIAKGTIEEKIIELQEEKKALMSKLMDDDFSKSENLISLKEDDILRLFEN